MPDKTLTVPPDMPIEDAIEIREAIWWNLRPGEPGADQPLHAFLGFTEEQWRTRSMRRGRR